MACACKDTKGQQVYSLCAGQDGGPGTQSMGHSWCCTNKIPVKDVCGDRCLDSDSWCGGKVIKGGKGPIIKSKDEAQRLVKSFNTNKDTDGRRTVSESDLNRIVKRTINESQLLLERPCGGGQPCSGDCCQQEGGNGIHVSNGCMAAKSNGRVYCDFSCPSGTSKKACGGKVKDNDDLRNVSHKELNESQLLNEGPYCNPDGADPSTVAGCQKHGVGCLHMAGGYFGHMGWNGDSYECGMVSPGGTGGNPLGDDELVNKTKGNMCPGRGKCPKEQWNAGSCHCFGKNKQRNDVKTMKESQLRNIIKRTINESGLLLERPGCGDDDDCASNTVCATAARDGDGACVPICRKGRKGDGCKPLSVADDSPKKEIGERRGKDTVTPPDTGKKKYYCVMKGRPCWDLDERDPSAKGNKGYRSERRCNKNC